MSTGINTELGGSLEFSEIAMDFASNAGANLDAFGDRWSGTTKYVLLVAYNTFSTNRSNISKIGTLGDPKVLFLGPCSLQGRLWVDRFGPSGGSRNNFFATR